MATTGWTYDDRIFWIITAEGLDLAPILSFHQCGGNVGDDHTSLLPSWLWSTYDGLTVLRVGDVGTGIGATRYARLIAARR